MKFCLLLLRGKIRIELRHSCKVSLEIFNLPFVNIAFDGIHVAQNSRYFLRIRYVDFIPAFLSFKVFFELSVFAFTSMPERQRRTKVSSCRCHPESEKRPHWRKPMKSPSQRCPRKKLANSQNGELDFLCKRIKRRSKL